jgi:hypothetical protein
MSKYDPLTTHLKSRRTAEVPMSFIEIEQLLGFALPASSATHRAWWSNNPQNNVMTRAWLKAGYRTTEVDIPGRKLVFRRTSPVPETGVAPAPPDEVMVDHVDHPLYGCMAGTVTFVEGVDLTEPADPGWADLIEDDDRWRRSFSTPTR